MDTAAIEYHRDELKKLQDQFAEVMRIRRKTGLDAKRLKKDIEERVLVIDTLTGAFVEKPAVPNYVSRDVDICVDYIRSHPDCPSRDLVAHLNSELANEPKRWKDQLDSNLFMTSMGRHLNRSGYVTSVASTSGVKTKLWHII